MGNSLQEQLLKAGLVNTKQVKKAKHEKRITKKQQQPKGKKTSDKASMPKEDSITREERLAHEQRNKELNRQRNEEKKKRETQARVRQLIKTNRLTLEEHDDDEPYYFVVGKRVKKMFLSEKISDQLTSGRLAIANQDGKFEIIPDNVARQILELNPKSLLVFNDPAADTPD